MTQPPPGDDQHAVVAFLADPASYGLSCEPVERVETHCSVVFLAGDRAYKLKRAIRYAALDYTTRALRYAACLAELRLNRRTAPELYLELRAITREPGGTLAFNGTGPPIDHVVVMRRFPQADLFDQMAERDALTPALMRDLGRAVARFHRTAEVTPAFGGSDAVRREIASNDHELAKVAGALDGAAVDTLSARSRAMLERLGPLLDRRRAGAKVRRCHGDLRLANICLYDGRPTLFDCIEFSDAVGCIDVLHDLAFLLMDLHLRGRGDLGNAVFNAYLDAAPETDGLRALPLFLALRAATRSYALAGSAQRQTTCAQMARRLVEARRHIDAGLLFLTPPPPRLVALGGTDRRRPCLAGRLAGLVPPPPGARILRMASGPDIWSRTEALVRAGCPVVIEGPFTDHAERIEVRTQADRLGLPWLGVWFGPLPDGLDPQTWHSLNVEAGALGALATVLGPG